MINEERVKQMTQMAIYEEGKGRSDVPMTQYFRHDYIGKEMVKSILTGICITMCHVFAVSAGVLYGEYQSD